MISVSIIIPTYNRLADLIICLTSVFKQNFDSFEVIVVDDCSTDNTKQALEKVGFLEKVVYLHNPKRVGVSRTKNNGIKVAKGRYLWFLDSDAEAVGSDCLEILYKTMESNASLGSVGCELLKTSIGLEVREHSFFINNIAYPLDSVDKDKLIFCDYLATCNCFVRADLVKQLGGFNEYYFYGYEDAELGKRLQNLGCKNAILPAGGVIHHRSTTARAANYKLFFKNRIRFALWNFSISKMFNLPLVDLENFIKVAIASRNFKTSQVRGQSASLLNQVFGKLGLFFEYVGGIAYGYVWNVFFLPKTLYQKNKREFLKGCITTQKNAATKYQYLLRECAFRVLRQCPKFIQSFLLNILVSKKQQYLNGLQTPGQLTLYVTNRCNARCSHCFYWKEVADGNKKELSLEKIESIAKSLVNPLNTLSITGGEPFMRNDIVRICQVFYQENGTKKINIVTNGFFTEKILQNVQEVLETCSIDLNIQVSLDGLRKTHNKIRKIDIFDKALQTLRELEYLSSKFKNLQVTVETTVSRDNLYEVASVRELLAREFPTVHHGFQFVRSPEHDVYSIDRSILSGLDPESTDPLLSVEEMGQVLNNPKLKSGNKHALLSNYVNVMNKGIVRMKKERKPLTKCLAGKYDGVVWPDGQVSVCEFVKPFANLADFNFDFYQLWHSPAANRARQKVSKCFCTHGGNLMNAMQFDKNVLLEVLNYSNE